MRSTHSTQLLGLISMTLGVVAITLAAESSYSLRDFFQASSPLFFPAIIAIGLIFNGLIILRSALRQHLPSSAPLDSQADRTDQRTLLGLLTLSLYWASMPWLGFWASSSLVIAALAMLFRAASAIRVLIIALVFPYLVIQIFWNAGHIILPQPTVFPWF